MNQEAKPGWKPARRKETWFLLLALLLVSAPGASANLGLRGGLTMEPDQVHVGGHLDLGPLADHIGFRPNVEIGFGDDVLVVAMNLEIAYRFDSEWRSWSPYVGGGMGINVVDPDNDALVGSSSTKTGALLLAGVERGLTAGGRLFFESKVGLTNAPDFKLTVGWTFSGRTDRIE